MVKSGRLESETGEERFSEEYVSLIMDSLVIPTDSFGYQVAESVKPFFASDYALVGCSASPWVMTDVQKTAA